MMPKVFPHSINLAFPLIYIGGTTITVVVLHTSKGPFCFFLFCFVLFCLAALRLRCCTWAFSSCSKPIILHIKKKAQNPSWKSCLPQI